MTTPDQEIRSMVASGYTRQHAEQFVLGLNAPAVPAAPPPPPLVPTVRAARQRTAEIRAWARERGMKVSDRGKLPAGVIRAWEAAQ